MAYIANKLGTIFLTLFGVASLVFFLFTVLPGDPAQMMLDQNEDSDQLEVIKAKFGFNRSSVGLWVGDKLKGALVGFAIMFPLLWVLMSLVGWLGTYWWVYGFGILLVFQLVMMVLYPMVIMPLFNKLSPLEEGELKDRLMALSDRSGFKAQTIQVIDGSKRSSHSNAYFTGFGKFRLIVLYDTLIDQLSVEELEAVLAHEIGHYKNCLLYTSDAADE